MQKFTDEEIIKIIMQCIERNTETDAVEFKNSRGGLPNDIWKSITAFSNKPSGGGMIVFGVEESLEKKFKLSSLINVHDLVERFTNYFNDRIVNADRPQYRILEAKGHIILAIILNSIQEEKKPCFDSRHGMDRGAYIRDGNTDRPITDDELRHFIRSSSAYKYDLSTIDHIKTSDLDSDRISSALKDMAERTGRTGLENTVDRIILQNLNVTANVEGRIKTTLAGVLVFGKPDIFIRSPFNRYAIRCVHYAGSSPSSTILDNQDIVGPLNVQIDAMRAFVLRNIPKRAMIHGSRRVEAFAYPEEAIREILANAVIHRDYSITETYTQVRVFTDRIEVLNPGNLPPGVTINNIKDMQFSRNAVIASLMRDLNYLEEYGRGIDLVFSCMQEANLPRPIFRNIANIFSVTLLGEKFSKLTERQLSIWQMTLNSSRLTAKSLVDQLGFSRPTVVGDLNILIELGLVNQTGSGTHIYYEVNDSPSEP